MEELEMPRVLYKYMPPPGATAYADQNLRRIFEKYQIRLTNSAEVNDLFERHPNVIDDLNEESACAALERLWDNGPAGAVDSSKRDAFRQTYASREAIRDNGGQALDLIRSQINNGMFSANLSQFGFYSLSEIRDCVLMWAHYADSHRGICIGFDSNFMLFPRNSDPVRYSDARPSVSARAILNASQGALQQDLLWEILFTKSTQWQYEREWRFVGWHPDGNYIAPGGELIEFDPRTIVEIIFGARCRAEHKQQVRAYAAKLPALQRIMRCERSPDRFALDLVDDATSLPTDDAPSPPKWATSANFVWR